MKLNAGEIGVNLVFQGGGVKGAAYSHVLDKKPPHVKIVGVGGTSAGAIVAALIAAGKESQIATLMKSTDLSQFIVAHELERQKRIFAACERAAQFCRKFKSGARRAALWGAASWLWNEGKQIGQDIEEVLDARGLFSSEPLRAWLRKHLDEMKFCDVTAVGDLRIVAANVLTRRYRIYSKANYPQTRLVDAVLASASIPVFFQPYAEGAADVLVDGGILSNFPAFLFAADETPTIGFRLKDFPPPAEVKSPVGFLSGLIQTMAEAHDVQRETPRDFAEYPILVPNIAATEFSLPENQINLLAELGKAVGERVNWTPRVAATAAVQAPPETPRRSAHYDPKPLATLDRCLEAANEIVPLMNMPGVRPESLLETVDFRVWVQSSLDSIYECHSTFEVQGCRPLLAMRFGIALSDALIPRAVRNPSSIVDLDLSIASRCRSGPSKVVLLPVSSTTMKKDYLVFFSPPVTSDEGPRELFSRWSSPEDVREAFHTGHPDVVYYSTRHRADLHKLKLRMTVNFSTKLPLPSLEGEHWSRPGTLPAPVTGPDGDQYLPFAVDFPEREVPSPALPRLELKFRWRDGPA